MRLPTIKNGLAHVACLTRLGSITRTGPITGKSHHITIRGVWIDAEEAETMVEQQEEIFCHRQNKNITINPVVYL